VEHWERSVIQGEIHGAWVSDLCTLTTRRETSLSVERLSVEDENFTDYSNIYRLSSALNHDNKVVIEQVGLSGNASHLYVGGVRFESRMGYQLSLLFFHCFPHSYFRNSGTVCQSRHGLSLPYPFPFIITITHSCDAIQSRVPDPDVT
jgi:hypothetical protein